MSGLGSNQTRCDATKPLYVWQFGYTCSFKPSVAQRQYLVCRLPQWRYLTACRSVPGGPAGAVTTSTRISSAQWPRLVAMPFEVPPNRIPRPKGWKDEDGEKNSDWNRRHPALQEWWVVNVRAAGRPVDRHRRWSYCAPSRCRSARGQDSYNEQNVHQQPYSHYEKETTHENDHR